jgi:hypothetical protein
MPYAGVTLKQREAAAFIAAKWQNVDERHKALATAQAESKLSIGAWNDNFAEDDVTLLSRDCGLFQINVKAEDLPEKEPQLRTDSQIPYYYESVARYNVAVAKQMWDERKFQPWVAVTSGWAWWPAWWVWRQVDKEPVGPWIATGRYIQKAIVGWANWHLLIAKTKNENGAVASAYNQQVKWKVEGELGLSAGKVAWLSHPPKPEEPPEDGVGPRPNSGA